MVYSGLALSGYVTGEKINLGLKARELELSYLANIALDYSLLETRKRKTSVYGQNNYDLIPYDRM